MNDCIKRDVCVFHPLLPWKTQRKNICKDCGHYITYRKLTAPIKLTTVPLSVVQEVLEWAFSHHGLKDDLVKEGIKRIKQKAGIE